MNIKEQLEEKKKQVEATFNELETRRQETAKILEGITTEQIKLQGEFRLLEDLIKKQDENITDIRKENT